MSRVDEELDLFEEAVKKAERAALKYILSKVEKKDLLDYGVNVVLKREGKEGVNLNVDVSIVLSPFCKENPKKLAEEAGKKALEVLEEVLSKLELGSPARKPEEKKKLDNNPC